ncbi:DEAD/DEAH box helicase [Polluticoccus soli]|uniref:DEAD/DEAH box helicase n=1 Tax=Polluticoccus soli TaxID=3034150 RepID=UPI0023E332A3|nr:DEAD/DEAH box helicase family protein [Flavipsychrobacter sp. JY13-12]
MSQRIIEVIKRIDLPTLHSLVGPVILKAIKSIHQEGNETTIAEILSLKYGYLILNYPDTRKALINSLSPSDALSLSKACSLDSTSSREAYNKLIAFFEKAYNTDKSRLLVNFLGLDDQFILKHTTDSRTAVEEISVRYGESMKIVPYLHPYQKKVKDEAMTRLIQRTEKSFFIQMPTGSGKTFMALECFVDLLRRPQLYDGKNITNNKFLVWLVDRNELAEQAFQSFVKLWKLRGDRTVKAYRLFKDFEPDFSSTEGGVVFAGFDKLYAILKNQKHAAYKSVLNLIANTELLTIDEAHHSLAETYYQCISKFRETPLIKLLGLSATPGTNDYETTKKIVELYSSDKISIRDPDWKEVPSAIKYLQDLGYLAKLDTKLLETGINSKDDDTERVLDDLASNSDRNEKVMEQIQIAHDNEESTIVFACTIDHVYALLILCRSRNINAKFIIGEVDQADRVDILREFREGKFRILINLDILSTGIDLPNVNKVIIAKPISSPNLISQILGRALRGPRNGGNETNTIINIKDNLVNFPGASFLYHYYEGDWQKI